jgi:VanZ family protein
VLASAAAVIAQQVGLYGPAGPVQPAWFPSADKLQHALGFALPMFLVLTTSQIYAARAGRTLRPLVVAAVAGVLAANAVVSEIVQARPGSGRSGDVLDAVADLVGIALGWLAFRRLRPRLRLGSAVS